MAEPTTEPRAYEMLALRYRNHPAQKTGLRKQCQECGRMGWVFLVDSNRAAIVWDLPARSDHDDGGPDIDTGRLSIVFEHDFGCGYH